MSPLKIAGWIIGFAIGHYVGTSLLIPLVGTILFAWLLKTFKRTDVILSVSVQAGHLSWIMAAALILHEFSAVVIFNFAIMGIGLLWLLIRPNLWSVLYLFFWQVFGVWDNGTQFFATVNSASPHKSLVAHLLFRLMAIAALVHEYNKLEKEKSEAVSA